MVAFLKLHNNYVRALSTRCGNNKALLCIKSRTPPDARGRTQKRLKLLKSHHAPDSLSLLRFPRKPEAFPPAHLCSNRCPTSRARFLWHIQNMLNGANGSNLCVRVSMIEMNVPSTSLNLALNAKYHGQGPCEGETQRKGLIPCLSECPPGYEYAPATRKIIEWQGGGLIIPTVAPYAAACQPRRWSRKRSPTAHSASRDPCRS